MEVFIQLVKDIGVPAAVFLIAMVWLYDRSKAETKTENTVSDIAGNSSRELSEVHKQIGDIRQQLGMAQGQNIILMDNLKTLESKRESEAVITKDKIYALTEKVEKQTILISRHEGRIAELESESKRKDEVIATKEHEIIDLKMETTRQKGIIEMQEKQLAEQGKSLQLVTRAQTLDDTLQFTEAELSELADPLPTVTPTTETNETKEDAA